MNYRYIIPLALLALVVMASMPVNAATYDISNTNSKLTSNLAWNPEPSSGTGLDVNPYDVVRWDIKYENYGSGVAVVARTHWRIGDPGIVIDDDSTACTISYSQSATINDYTAGVGAGPNIYDIYRRHRYEQPGGMIWELT